MAEEHRCETPEGHRLCANNCGFFGSPATMNLCSKCYRDFRLKEEQATSAKSAVEKSLAPIPPPAAGSAGASSTSAAAVADIPAVITPAAVESTAAIEPPRPTQPSRCASCLKRIGLTGFPCRCGTTFCNAHRYPEQHGCTFDFKAAGRAAIAMANPVVKSEKLDKI